MRSDGIVYTAKNCAIKSRNTAIMCTTVPGVGENHVWTLVVTAPETSAWTVIAKETTSYKPALVITVTNSDFMPTGLTHSVVTLSGANF